MPELLAKNVSVYIRESRHMDRLSDTFHEHTFFVSTPSDNYALAYLIEGDPDFELLQKRLGNLSQGSVFLDRLYSLPVDWKKFDEFKTKLQESHTVVPLNDEKFKEQYETIKRELESSEMKPEDTQEYQKKLNSLTEQQGRLDLYQNAMIYVLLLTDQGWIEIEDDYLLPFKIYPYQLDTLEKFGYIEVKRFGSKIKNEPYFAKLTEKGTSLQKELIELLKKN